MAEKADQEFYHEMVKFARGEDHDIKPGSVWMIKAEIAKRLTANSPDLLADAKRPDLRRPRSRSDTRHQGPRGFEARMIFGPSAVCTENLDSDVLVMKSTDQGMRHDASDPLNRARDRRIFGQGAVRSRGVVIARVRFHDLTQMLLA